SFVEDGLPMDTYFAIRRERQRRAARKQMNVKPRRSCPECGKWTAAPLYMHMIFSHDWNEQQLFRFTSANALASHLVICRQIDLKPRNQSGKSAKEKQSEYSMDGSARQSKQLPIRPPILPPLPEQLSESQKGLVLCPVPRCGGRFTNHDSLAYHCMIEHSELGAAGTPQNFAIRQYRFETKDEY
ncbi:hypothetical protein OSTOST_16944, partial [Ostertagia ostertagi]